MRNITALRFRTIDPVDGYKDLTDEQLSILSTILLKLNRRTPPYVNVLYRGINKKYLSERLKKEDDEISESTLLKRLFYFGDKSKHYFQNNEFLKRSKYLKDINDNSISSNREIFSKLNNLSHSKNPKIIEFVNQNQAFFSFFKDSKNKEVFADGVRKSGVKLRDYYLTILHTAGKIGISEKSTLVSTSNNYGVAKSFPNSGADYIIVYVSRGNSSTRKDDKVVNFGLPYLKNQKSIFPEQYEITLRGALFPHNMLGVIHPKDENMTVNPYIFSEENKNIDLSKNSLIIDQSTFEDDLKEMTTYTRWLYTYDYEDFYHGGEIA